MLRYGWRRKDVLSLGQGEGSQTTPDFIIKAAEEALQQGKTFYGPVLGHPEARQALSDYYRRIYGLEIPLERLFMTGSGTTAMHLALTSLLEEGDEVVALTPIWKNLLGAVELAKAQTIQVPLRRNGRKWYLDLEAFFSAVTPHTKALLIVSPSNPTGWMISPEEIQAILSFARDRGLWIIADEVYGRIVYDRTFAPSFLEYAEADDKLYVVNSFSKSYAMTGWRLGWLVGPEISEPVIRDIALYDNMGPASFIQFAGTAALEKGEPFLREQISLWDRNRKTVENFFEQYPDIDCPEIAATFYCFFRDPKEPDCMAFGKYLIDQAGLSLAPGCAFGKCAKGYTRLCFAVSDERLEQALDRLSTIIK
jgi:aspartate/methionine/tyrosine aminotransferase